MQFVLRKGQKLIAKQTAGSLNQRCRTINLATSASN